MGNQPRTVINTDNLKIRTGPGTNYESVGSYSRGDVIKSVYRTEEGDGRTWAVYRGGRTGVDRYVCYVDKDGTHYLM